LVVTGRLSWGSTGFFRNPMSTCANWLGPSAYICLIWSLMSFSRIASQLSADAWRALFHCSHMSHATFHNFLIISDVQHLLGLWDQICFHICSCWCHHSMLSQPSQIYCFPILFCLIISWSWPVLMSSGEFHVLSMCISWSLMVTLVPLFFSQSSNCFSDLSHCHACLYPGMWVCALCLLAVAHIQGIELMT